MRNLGVIAAAAVAFTMVAGEGYAQKLAIGPEYEKNACDCRRIARTAERWPDCMKRRGYTVLAVQRDLVICPDPRAKKK